MAGQGAQPGQSGFSSGAHHGTLQPGYLPQPQTQQMRHPGGSQGAMGQQPGNGGVGASAAAQ